MLRSICLPPFNSCICKVNISDVVHSFVKNRGIKTNAENHLNQKYVLQLDLYRFYESITDRRIFGLLKFLGYHPNVAFALSQLMTSYLPTEYYYEIKKENKFKNSFLSKKNRVLPQGAPTSPSISNLILHNLDRRLSAACNKMGLVYSRYADDITISGKDYNLISLSTIKKIIRSEGFTINNTKTRYTTPRTSIKVNGLTVTDRVFVKKKLYKSIKTHLYFSYKYGVEDHLRYLKIEKINYKDWLLGNILFINSIEPEKGGQLFSMYRKINWLL